MSLVRLLSVRGLSVRCLSDRDLSVRCLSDRDLWDLRLPVVAFRLVTYRFVAFRLVTYRFAAYGFDACRWWSTMVRYLGRAGEVEFLTSPNWGGVGTVHNGRVLRSRKPGHFDFAKVGVGGTFP